MYKVRFALDMWWKRKDLSSQLSWCLTSRSGRIWEMPPVLFSFIKVCKLFFSTARNHTWELWNVILFLHAWQLLINAMISLLFFFFIFFILRKNDLNELPGDSHCTCAAFQSKESQICDLELFKECLHNRNCTCDCNSQTIIIYNTMEGFYVRSLQQVSPRTWEKTFWNISTVLYNKNCLHFMGLWISFSI